MEVSTTIDVQAIRKQFPILHQKVNGHDLVYFDNAATSQKPKAVIDALTNYYTGFNANIHRGIHTLAEKATKAFEETRDAAQKFVNAAHREEIIFLRGVTEAINLVASTYGRAFLKAGDEIIISGLEHHSNIVPWQLLCEEKRCVIKTIPISPLGEFDLEGFNKLISSKTKIVAVNHASNSLGTINPIQHIISKAHDAGARFLIVCAHSSSHIDIELL